MDTDLKLRTGTPEDAATCGPICYEAFRSIAERHSFPPDFPTPEIATGFLEAVLSRDDVFSVVAERGGRVVGSNFLWESDSIAGVGPITVDPGVQDGSIGRRLMNAVMDRAVEREFAGVRLVQAGYHTRSLSLYAKLGYVVREPLVTFQGPALGFRLPGYDVRAATEADVEACNRLAFAVHGHDRSNELRGAIAQGTATVVEHAGQITGYATVVAFFGHAVAETNRDLMALIGAAEEFGGPGFLLPSRNAELFRWCLERGLRVVQTMTLMTVGLYNEPRGAYLPSVLF